MVGIMLIVTLSYLRQSAAMLHMWSNTEAHQLSHMTTECEYRVFTLCLTHTDGTGFIYLYFFSRFIALI